MPKPSKQKPKGNKYRQLADSCAEWLSKGCGVTGTARHHGISRRTLHSWQEFPHFQELIELKREEWRQECLSDIQADKQWTSKAWLLERCFRGEYDPPHVRKAGQAGNVVVQVAVWHPAMQEEGQEQGQEQLTEVKMVDHDES
jgi:hypothetical protein